MKTFFLIILLTFQLASCQQKQDNCTEDGFCVLNRKLYYNQKPLLLGIHIEKLVEKIGKYDRIEIDSSGGIVNKGWKWSNGGEAYVNNENKVQYFNVNMNNSSKVYNNIEDVVKNYGVFESVQEETTPLHISTFYIWDKLGFNAFVEKDTVEQINIYPIHIKKFLEYKDILFEHTSQDTKENKKNYQTMIDRCPKEEYKGNFSYDGNTVNLERIGYQGWEAMISGLKIKGEDYSAGGDSKNWFREIKLGYELRITINRFSNARESGALSEEKIGTIDGIQSIEIWRLKDNEKM